MFASISFHVGFEILAQPGNRNKLVGFFPSHYVTVVTLAALVIVADQTFPASSVVKAVFQSVGSIGRSPGQQPDDEFDNRAVLQHDLFVQKKPGLRCAWTPV